MPTENSGQETRTAAARAFADEIGAEHLQINVQSAVDTHVRLCEQMTRPRPDLGEPAHDVPLQNVQARLRGSMIWMVANLRNYLLLATSNKSEAAVGYATMDGDTSGRPVAHRRRPEVADRALAPLGGGVPRPALGDLVTKVPAMAELRPQGGEADRRRRPDAVRTCSIS
jgi:hypothetical protein